MRKTTLLLTLLLGALPLGAARAADPVPYPEGYRDWRHVKSMVIQEGHPLYESFGGIHHIYANPSAIEGFRTGRFADGAVFVFDLLDVEVTGERALVEGARKVVGVMHKDAARWPATGGWGFEGFKGDGRAQLLDADALAACFACHAARADSGFVFTAPRP
jgi:cytochrome c553